MLELWEVAPEAQELFRIMECIGWPGRVQLGQDGYYQAFRNSWYAISAYEDGQLVGYGRILSDGISQAFICDLVVDPSQQGQGIGSTILRKLLSKCDSEGIGNVQLFSAPGRASYYHQFGFEDRASEAPGMTWVNRERPWCDGSN